MKALYFDGRLALRDLPMPRPKQGEALVRVRRAGICGTDREILTVQEYKLNQGLKPNDIDKRP